MEQTAAEAKDENVAKMGEPLGVIYSALWQEVATLHFHWKEYVELFGTDPERIPLLNRVAPHFFRMIQDGVWELSLLGLTRLTDPAVSKVRKEEKTNLTVQALPELIDDPTLKENVTKLVAEAVAATKFARSWRDRRIAHRDLELALEQPTTPLADGSRADVKTALKALADVLNEVASHYLGNKTGFEHGAASGGASSLLYVLEVGTEAQDAERRQLEGIIQAEDQRQAEHQRIVEKRSNRRKMILVMVTMLCGFGLWVLTPVIWFFTIYLAYLTSFRALLAALFFPFLVQLYWMWALWTETGNALNLFTLLCLAWVTLAVVRLIARATVEMT
jgi:hypothetical protein